MLICVYEFELSIDIWKLCLKSQNYFGVKVNWNIIIVYYNQNAHLTTVLNGKYQSEA